MEEIEFIKMKAAAIDKANGAIVYLDENEDICAIPLWKNGILDLPNAGIISPQYYSNGNRPIFAAMKEALLKTDIDFEFNKSTDLDD